MHSKVQESKVPLCHVWEVAADMTQREQSSMEKVFFDIINVERASFLEQIALEISCYSCWPLHLVSPSQLMNDASRKGKIKGIIRRTATRHLVPLWRCFCSWHTDHFLHTQTLPPYFKAAIHLPHLSLYYPSKRWRFKWISATTNQPQGSLFSSYSHWFATILHDSSCKIHR